MLRRCFGEVAWADSSPAAGGECAGSGCVLRTTLRHESGLEGTLYLEKSEEGPVDQGRNGIRATLPFLDLQLPSSLLFLGFHWFFTAFRRGV